MIRSLFLKEISKRTKEWVFKHQAGLMILNFMAIVLVLLRSADYFNPFWTITINGTFFILLIVSILLLEITSRSMFVIALLFWIFTCMMKIFKMDVWADRSSIYVFQSVFLGVLLLFIEFRKLYNTKK